MPHRTLEAMPTPLTWLQPGDPFPDPANAWGDEDPAPGLLAVGADLEVDTLCAAYRQGIFPWFSQGQPILWWSTAPRLVLPVAEFKPQRSLCKTMRSGWRSGRLVLRFDHDFAGVVAACAQTARPGQNGTWIVPAMAKAYQALHRAGHAHSVETWWDGVLVGGLYAVNLGGMVFGESMFSHQSNASKIALSALVAHCQAWGVSAIDCQQDTAHLARQGARLWSRSAFAALLEQACDAPAPDWQFQPKLWQDWLEAPHA